MCALREAEAVNYVNLDLHWILNYHTQQESSLKTGRETRKEVKVRMGLGSRL